MESTSIFKNASIRRHYDEVSQKWYFSIVDIIGIVTKTSNSRSYWKVLKSRLNKTHNQLVTACNQLKMRANDGKSYLTDTADEGTLHKIIELVSLEGASHFRQYVMSLSSEKMGEIDRNNFNDSTLPEISSNSYPQPESHELYNTVDKEEYILPIDAYRENDSIIIKTFVAGMNIENIFISATRQAITIKCNREIPKNIYEENYSTPELYQGKFSRHIKLPYEVEIDKIEASEHHGLLTIRLPMINGEPSRKIKIESV